MVTEGRKAELDHDGKSSQNSSYSPGDASPHCLGLSPQRTDVFAESGQQIAQPLVEEVLREAVTDLDSCHLCLGWSLHTLWQHDDGVRATIVNEQGEQRQVKASYVLGCDGARSVVRAAIGANYEGTSDQRPNFGLVFRAPELAAQQPHGPAVHYWVLNPAYPRVMGRMDPGGSSGYSRFS